MTTPRHFARSVFSLALAQLVTWLATAAVTLLVPRFLGDVSLGKLAFGFAFTYLVGLLADFGTATYLTKEIARNPSRAAALTANALAMRLPLGVIAAAIAVGAVIQAGYDSVTIAIVLVLAIGVVVEALGTIVAASLQGLQRMQAVAVSTAATKLSFAAVATAVLMSGGGAIEVAVATSASVTIGLLVAAWAFARRVPLSARMEWRLWRDLFFGGLPFFVWQGALVVYGEIDIVLLSLFTHDAVVGWYAAAYRIVTIPVFVPTIIVTVAFPALSALAGDAARFATLARRAMQIVLLLTVPMAVGVMLLAERLFAVLGYPPGFANSLVPILLLAPHIPLASADMVIGTVLNARDRQRQWALAAVAAAVLNPALNLLAIPVTQTVYGNGAVGAAAVTTLTELFLLVVGIRLLPRGVFAGALSLALRCLLAAGGMAVVVWSVRELPLPVPVLVGMLVYGVASLLFGTLTKRELAGAVSHLLPRLVRPSPGVVLDEPGRSAAP